MLQPKRVKYRNHHRGRRKGISVAGSTINFGEYAIKAMECAWVTARQIEAARRAMTRHAKRGGRVWIRIYPDKSVTARAAPSITGWRSLSQAEYCSKCRAFQRKLRGRR